jgi:hypothetical protein
LFHALIGLAVALRACASIPATGSDLRGVCSSGEYLKKHWSGIVRVSEGGVSIVAEEWSFPKAALGEFLSTIQQPLGLGQLELNDGRKVHGFLCETAAAETAKDISETGGWRLFLTEYQFLRNT